MLSRRLATLLLKRPELHSLSSQGVDFSSKQKSNKAHSKSNKKSSKKISPSKDQMYDRMAQSQSSKASNANQLRIPSYAGALLFVSCVPQSIWFYKILWSELVSDAFIECFQKSATWISTQVFIEGAALTSAAMIDYGVVKNEETDKKGLRKKALTFCKYHPFLIGWSLTLIDVPSHHCLLPLILAIVHMLFKNGVLQNYQLLPMRYYYARTFIMIYNLFLLLIMWYMGRMARKEKLNLELEFFHRVQRMLMKYDQEFEGFKFDDGI